MRSIQDFVTVGINSLADLQEALQLAMQLEFSTLPPYLCAEWSVGRDQGDDPSGVGTMLNAVARQEMNHFAFAGNILAAIGGTPQCADAAFVPSYPTNTLPGGIPQKLAVDLQPLSMDQLQVFMQIETPEWTPVGPSADAAPATIGAFYDTISAALSDLQPVISGSATQLAYGEVKPITSVKDALAAVAQIKLEGEGTSQSPDEGPAQLAHYYTFRQIYEGKQLVQSNEVWGYTGPAITFPKVLPFSGGTSTDTFNNYLKTLLTDLQAIWAQGGNTPLEDMFSLASEGQKLIAAGTRPEFRYPS